MKLNEFNFNLPKELIANSPIIPRHNAKLMEVIGPNVFDRTFIDLPNILKPGDLLVFNNSKVIPAKLFAQRGDLKVEFYLNKPLGKNRWSAFTKKFNRLKDNDILEIGDNFRAQIISKNSCNNIGEIIIDFFYQDDFIDKLNLYGQMPLPPYINRKDISYIDDSQYYQTVFAKEEGSVAAPTAGLHFTNELLELLLSHGIKIAFITLHVGAGTFLPVKTENIEEHNMHYEYCTISKETADLINNTKANGNDVIAVGSTSLRTIEAASDQNMVKPFSDQTNIFITPGYSFKTVTKLITNFHLPKSTLFILVCAFAGIKNMHKAYEYAKMNNYRFYSYGDGCLLHLNS
jgi:S-adenosylmethionine:tRNA ribosyltransferase-isomerase